MVLTDTTGMTTIDIVIIGLFIATAVSGYRKGFLRQLATVVGVVAGIAACRLFSGEFAQWLEARGWFASALGSMPGAVASHAAGAVASTLIFIGACLAVHIAASMLRSAVHAVALGFVDSFLGMITSVFIGFLVLSILLNVCQAFKQGGSVIDKSTLADGKVAEMVLDLAPRTFGVATAILTAPPPETEKP